MWCVTRVSYLMFPLRRHTNKVLKTKPVDAKCTWKILWESMTTGSSMTDPCTICWVHILKSARHTKGLVKYKSIILPTNMLIFDHSNQNFSPLAHILYNGHCVLFPWWRTLCNFPPATTDNPSNKIPVFAFNFILENSIKLNGGNEPAEFVAKDIYVHEINGSH